MKAAVTTTTRPTEKLASVFVKCTLTKAKGHIAEKNVIKILIHVFMKPSAYKLI